MIARWLPVVLLLCLSQVSCLKLDFLLFDGDPATLQDYDFTSERLDGIDPSRITSELVPVGKGSDKLHVIRVERDVRKLDPRLDPDLELTVVFSHGNRGNMTRYWNRVGYFEELGFHVVAYDYRGYGASSGKTSEAHLYEDAATAYDYAVAHGARAVVSVGYSMGGAPAIWLCSKDSGRAVLACFTEAAFASAEGVIGDATGFDLPGAWLMDAGLDNEARIASVRVPFLLMHGQRDDRVAFEHSERLWAAVRYNNEHNRYYAIEGAGHRNVPLPSYTGVEEPREYSHPDELPDELRKDYAVYAERIVAFVAAATESAKGTP